MQVSNTFDICLRFFQDLTSIEQIVTYILYKKTSQKLCEGIYLSKATINPENYFRMAQKQSNDCLS